MCANVSYSHKANTLRALSQRSSCRSKPRSTVVRCEKLDYKTAGVNIDAGNELVKRIKKLNPNIGGFNGMYPFGDSYLVAGTDGVGTKLKLAFEMQKHDTIGIDLVAMCVNDVVVVGAKPLFFLDYFATGELDVDVAEKVVKGINQACVECGALLMGGETAEMPGMYAGSEYDLAGFAVGSVKKTEVVTGTDIAPGDVLIALPSTGIHSNGFSLVRRVLQRSGLTVHEPSPWDSKSLVGESLLTPTALYVNDVLAVHNSCGFKGAVHITGGGFYENIPRVLPEHLGCSIETTQWQTPTVFNWIQAEGSIAREEMFRTFNMGVGMILVLDPSNVDQVKELIPLSFEVGSIVNKPGIQLL